jgi:hypothetical protein
MWVNVIFVTCRLIGLGLKRTGGKSLNGNFTTGRVVAAVSSLARGQQSKDVATGVHGRVGDEEARVDCVTRRYRLTISSA